MKNKKLSFLISLALATNIALPALADTLNTDVDLLHSANNNITINLPQSGGSWEVPNCGVNVVSQGNKNVNMNDGVQGNVTIEQTQGDSITANLNKNNWSVSSYYDASNALGTSDEIKVSGTMPENTTNNDKTYVYKVTFTCNSQDDYSGLGYDGLNDKNTSTVQITVKVPKKTAGQTDSTAPIISPLQISGTEGANGWYASSVSVIATAIDPETGVKNIYYTLDGGPLVSANNSLIPFDITTDGEHTVVVTAVNGNGLTSSNTFYVKVDKTAPTTSHTLSPETNGNGWNNSDVTVNFTASDDLSGVASLTPNKYIFTAEGVDQSVTATATDKAGNSKQDTVKVNIDKTAPIISGAATIDPNANGWYRNDVTVHYDYSDGLSGISDGTNSYDDVITGEGDNLESSHTVIDKAGNSNVASVLPIKIDRTAPTISKEVSSHESQYGWYNSDVTVNFTASDALSGVASLTPDKYTFTLEGADQSATATATDNAGNSATSTATVNIDKTAPTISGAATTSPNENGWYNGDVTVKYTATDALSGVATVTPDQTISSEGAGQSTTGIATDKAGNSAQATVLGINIDKTAPSIEVQDNGIYLLNQKVTWSATDSVSGLATSESGTIDTSSVGKKQQTITAKDNAGNTITKTIYYTVQYGKCELLQPMNLTPGIDFSNISVFKLGSTIPVKFKLYDGNGTIITDSGLIAKIQVCKYSNAEIGDVFNPLVSTSAATTGTLFRYDSIGQQYIFNLSTKNSSFGPLLVNTRYVAYVNIYLNAGDAVPFQTYELAKFDIKK